MCSPGLREQSSGAAADAQRGMEPAHAPCLHRWLETDRRRTLAGVVACWALQIHSNALPRPLPDGAGRLDTRGRRSCGARPCARCGVRAASSPRRRSWRRPHRPCCRRRGTEGHGAPRTRRRGPAVQRERALVCNGMARARDPVALGRQRLRSGSLPWAPLAVCALAGAGLAIRRRVTGRGSQAAATPAVYLLVAGRGVRPDARSRAGDWRRADSAGRVPTPCCSTSCPARRLPGAGRFAVFVVLALGVVAGVGAAARSPDGADRSASSPCRR